MDDVFKINVPMLKSYEKDFNDELNNFNNKTYTTFSSSYLNHCSDPYVRRMFNELQTHYNVIKKGYENIDKWWSDYNANIDGLENYLSDNGIVGAISEPSVRNSVNQLPGLKKYNLKFAGIIPINKRLASNNPVFTNNMVSLSSHSFSSIYSDYKNIEVNANEVVNNDDIVKQMNEVISSVSESVSNWAENLSSGIKDFFVLTGAKISLFGETVSSKLFWVDDSDIISYVGNASSTSKAESIWDKVNKLWNDTTSNVGNWFEEVGINISNDVKSFSPEVAGLISDAQEWWNSDALPWIQEASGVVWDVVKSTGATNATIFYSAVEGFLQFDEAILDFLVLGYSVGASVVTGLYDGVQAIHSAINGNEWSSATMQMWEGTMGFVSTKYASGWFDSLWGNTSYGQWISENTNAFPLFRLLEEVGLIEPENGLDVTRSIVSGVGYIAGVVILAIATFGGSLVAEATAGTATAASAVSTSFSTYVSSIAAAAGFSKGTQNAWADGADLGEGLGVGTFTGLWEGLQFYLGFKISGLNLFGADGIIKSIGSSGLGTNILNSLARVILDGVDGGFEGFVMPVFDSIYKDGYYDENGNYIEFTDDQNIFDRYSELFDDNGGWSAVWTQATIGSATSLLSEVFDFGKIFSASQDAIKPEIEGIEKEVNDVADLVLGKKVDTVVDVPTIRDEIGTEKLFDYDSSQSIVDLSPVEKIVPGNDINLNGTVEIEPPLKNMTYFGEQNLSKYQQQIEDFAARLGISYETAVVELNKSVKELIDSSEFGIRISSDNLELILDDGRFKNNFETNTSMGEMNQDAKTNVEQDIMNVPRNTLSQDRPVYGLALPQLPSDFKSSSDVYVHVPDGIRSYYFDGPGSWYGDVICIFKKDAVIDNVSFTLGDSFNYRDTLVASSAANPQFCGCHQSLLYDVNSLDEMNKIRLSITVSNPDQYLELQYHGVKTHSIDNLEMVIFKSEPSKEILDKLEAKGIPYKIDVENPEPTLDEIIAKHQKELEEFYAKMGVSNPVK